MNNDYNKLKININDLFISVSIVLFMIVVLLKPYFSTTISLIVLTISNLLLGMNILKRRLISLNGSVFILLSIIAFLPSIYKNAYLASGYNNYLLFYFLAILYAIMLFCSKLEKKHIEVLLKMAIIFAITTSIVTWISILNPSFYINKFISLLPSYESANVLNDFIINNMRMGLTNHYSRNAFYIILGILSFIYFYLKNKKINSIVGIVFLLATMLTIGKRGHFIFLIISLLITYIVFNKFSLKSLIKMIKIFIIMVFLFLFCYAFLPSTHMMYERLFNITSNISSGRFELYEQVWNLYQGNNFIGIGWGGFSYNTNFSFAGVHNDYIQLLCETGIIGLSMMMFVNISFLLTAYKFSMKKSNMSFIILEYNLFFLLYSFTGLPHYDFEIYSLYFIFNCFAYKFIDMEDSADE